MQRDSKNSRLGPHSFAGSFISDSFTWMSFWHGYKLCLQRVLLMQRSSKNSRLGPQSFAGSFVSDRFA